jgi:hypothetical protein
MTHPWRDVDVVDQGVPLINMAMVRTADLSGYEASLKRSVNDISGEIARMR